MKKTKLFTLLTLLLCTTTTLAETYNVNTDSELRAAIQNDKAIIWLRADIDLTNSTLEITGNRTVTVNLNNHTLDRKLTKRGAGGGQVFTVRSGSTLIINGGGTLKGGWGGDGGALLNNGGTVELTNVTITGNTADDSGGGIFNEVGGTLTMVDCTVTDNHCNKHQSDSGGGGIYNAGTLNMQGANVVTNNTLGDAVDNLYLLTGTVITVTGLLTGSNIGINLQGTTGIFTTGYATYYATSLDPSGQTQPSEFFTADDDLYYDVIMESAEAGIAKASVIYPVTTEDQLRTLVKTDGVKLKLGSGITVSKHITIPNRVTIDLNGYTLRGDDTPVTTNSDYKCIFIVAPEGNLTLSHGILADADNSATENKEHNGGAIVNKGTATLTDVNIVHCKAAYGAGIRNNAGATLTLDGGHITNNTGDGIYNEGTLNMKGAVVVKNNQTVDELNDNVYLKRGTIHVIGSLEGSDIGINMIRSGVFTTDYIVHNVGKAPSAYFSADFPEAFEVEFSGVEAALTGGPFYYIDRRWDDTNKKVVSTAKRVAGVEVNSMGDLDPYYDHVWLGNSFYVFTRDDVTFAGDVIVPDENHAKILLCDDSKLSVSYGGLDLVALTETGQPKLCIYGQLKNSGTLYVHPNTNEKYCPGIGTNLLCYDPLNIYGGTIDVAGSGLGGAGIGSAPSINSSIDRSPVLSEINIYGGIIKAQGGPGAAGIGSGAPDGPYFPEDYGNINIYGGTITAKGGSGVNLFSSDIGGAGIGGGNNNKQGFLYIYGGDITATGGLNAAGIGCGQNSGQFGAGIIHITGGHIVARGDEYAAGIGGGDGIQNYFVDISGGHVEAYGGTDAAGIGGGEGGNGGDITITGGYVYAQGKSNGAGLGGGEDGEGGVIDIIGGTVIAKAGVNETGHSAIGPGYVNDRYGFLTIGDGLMVRNHAGSAPCTADSRKDACWNHPQAYIDPCTHPDHTYSVDGRREGDHHTEQCAYCTTKFAKEEHNFVNGVCTVCGVEKMEIGTSISEELSVKSDQPAPANEYFDLQGRKFYGKPTKKGLYIVNGSLVVIK